VRPRSDCADCGAKILPKTTPTKGYRQNTRSPARSALSPGTRTVSFTVRYGSRSTKQFVDQVPQLPRRPSRSVGTGSTEDTRIGPLASTARGLDRERPRRGLRHRRAAARRGRVSRSTARVAAQIRNRRPGAHRRIGNKAFFEPTVADWVRVSEEKPALIMIQTAGRPYRPAGR